MDTLSYNHWNLILQAASILVAIFVGGIVWWYTLETKRLRICSGEQVGLLREQGRKTSRPFITGHVYSIESSRCECRIWNATDRVGHDINALVKQGANFFWSVQTMDFLPECLEPAGETLPLKRLPRNEALESMTNAYGNDANNLVSAINETQDSLVIFFRDMDGTLLCARRYFKEKEAGVFEHESIVLVQLT